MSIVTLFTKTAPTLGGLTFDAVLEDTLEISVDLAEYPIETGAKITDHRIINPMRWYLTGAMSDNPVRPTITDFMGGVLSNVTRNPWVAGVAGLSAGWLAGTDQTRSSSALDTLIKMMYAGEPFDINAGDIYLKNMGILRISRTKDPENEAGLIFVAELREVITLSCLPLLGQPSQYQLPKDDKAQSGAAALIKKGQQAGKAVGDAVNKSVNAVLDGLFT
ncbi:tail fiber protein [Edwardsiella phage PEi21]|uniref:Dit-like phage tail protein N-terminal domain-containing protein n=1 Tax=Edwardsiella phage PEi21 TaxID=1325372 RepID=N0DQQ6_9CAUD|nr:tail fiber protein [Edwardsiella phage PEi21]BAN16839.1 hypothetical protein [Edwardsiella phage PEi21]